MKGLPKLIPAAGLPKRLFLEGGAPVPAPKSRSRAAVETWERLSLEDPESKAREPSRFCQQPAPQGGL